MSNMIKNQERVIELIRKAMSKNEGEEFFIQKIDRYEPWYFVFGDDYYKGSYITIGNNSYKQMIENKDDIDRIKTRIEGTDIIKWQIEKSVLNRNNDDLKSLLLSYETYKTDSGEEYYRVKSVTKLKKLYPYLIECINVINNMPEDEIAAEEMINTLEDILELNNSEDENDISITSKKI